MQMKTTSRLTASLLRISVATLLLSHACRSIVRNSVWHDRQSLFTYATVRFAYTTSGSLSSYESFQYDTERRRAVSPQQMNYFPPESYA